jgi:hypothetical protein
MSLRIGFLRIGHDRCGGCRRICRCGRSCDCMVVDESLTRPLVCHDCLSQREVALVGAYREAKAAIA